MVKTNSVWLLGFSIWYRMRVCLQFISKWVLQSRGAGTTYSLIYMQPNILALDPSLTLFAFHRKCQTCSKINNISASAGISFSKLLGLILCTSRLCLLLHLAVLRRGHIYLQLFSVYLVSVMDVVRLNCHSISPCCKIWWSLNSVHCWCVR